MTTESGFKISPGDSVTASVVYGRPACKRIPVDAHGHHQGHKLHVCEPACLARHADVGGMDHRSAVGHEESFPCQTFGSVTFTNAQATVGSETGPIDDPDWQLAQVNMSDPAWNDASGPRRILRPLVPAPQAGQSFTVTQAAEPSTPFP